MAIIFTTERLKVRQYTQGDQELFFMLNGNEAVMQYIRPVSTREQSDKFLLENIDAYRAKPRQGRWAVEEKDTGIFVGSFAIIPVPAQPDRIQLGYSLLPENWGKGFASELTRGGLDYFFLHEPKGEIYGITEVPNIASQKVLLKAGFTAAGSFIEGEKELLQYVCRRRDQM